MSALELLDERFAWVSRVVDAATVPRAQPRPTFSDRFDRVALAPVVGPLLFLAVMWGVFQLTTTVAAPMQDALDRMAAGPLSDYASNLLGLIGLGGGVIEGFIVDGLIAGVGMLLTFAPVMAMMFLCLAALENSGYLARGAVVTDRMMRLIGLPGRAFLPLVVGFGCNVPAISAARVLPDARQRLLVSLLVPYTSCSARLAVYVLVATTFFGSAAGTVVFLMYLVSILLVIGIGLLLKATAIGALPDDPLFIDLPRYQAPLPKMLFDLTWGDCVASCALPAGSSSSRLSPSGSSPQCRFVAATSARSSHATAFTGNCLRVSRLSSLRQGSTTGTHRPPSSPGSLRRKL